MEGKIPHRYALELTRFRWEPAFAILATGAISYALPDFLSVGPRWLLFALIVLLLIPTVIAHHTGRHRWNHVFGIASNSVVTLALAGELGLLVTTLPSHREPPTHLLFSAFLMWVSNVLIFALWYWRLDGGGPIERLRHGSYGSQSFLFPQLQVESIERRQMNSDQWTPLFVDYLFLAFNLSTAFSPTDTLILGRWAKILAMAQSLISLSIVILLVARGINVL